MEYNHDCGCNKNARYLKWGVLCATDGEHVYQIGGVDVSVSSSGAYEYDGQIVVDFSRKSTVDVSVLQPKINEYIATSGI